MLRNKIELLQPTGFVIVMSDLAILAASIKTALLDIAKQTQALGVGLQNAAPGDRQGAPNNTVTYLLETSDTLTKYASDCENLLAGSASDAQNNKIK